MANPEHLAVLERGVDQWNLWRDEHSAVKPNLSEAPLSGANLSNANLREAILYRIEFRDVHLFGADLSNSDLTWADLRSANLGCANLHAADLSHAYLIQVDAHLADLTEALVKAANLDRANFEAATLTGADISGTYAKVTNFTRANLERADLSGADLDFVNFDCAIVGGTSFSDIDLSTASGLETVTHYGPSTVGIDTIYKSRGKIPEVFLRGCGVPEEFITYIGSMVGRPIEYYSCFISYAHEDKLFARRLHDALQGRGVRCWLDEKQMLPGDDNSVDSGQWIVNRKSPLNKELGRGTTAVRPPRNTPTQEKEAWMGTRQRTRTDERTRAKGAGGDSAESGWVSAERGVEERQGQAGAVAAGGGLYRLGAGCAKV